MGDDCVRARAINAWKTHQLRFRGRVQVHLRGTLVAEPFFDTLRSRSSFSACGFSALLNVPGSLARIALEFFSGFGGLLSRGAWII